MKKVIILSGNTGQGHNSCAAAIKEYFEEQQVSCDIVDAFTFVSENFARFISWGHTYMYRHVPGLFRFGYIYSNKHPSMFDKTSGVYKLLTSGGDAMCRYISEGQYDTVICTHVLTAIMFTDMMKHHTLSVRSAFVATDYTCYPGTEACDVEKYFIPCDSLMGAYQNCGISKDKLIATGIPVRKAFFETYKKEKAKQELNIRKNGRHLLVMCGSMGCGSIGKMVKRIEKGMPQGTEVSVVCGTNKRLYRKLNKKYTESAQIHIIGYTNDIPRYMDSADLYLTKPGGISVTEAAVKNLPMAFIDAVAGCEQYNMDFFVNMGTAITAHTGRQLAKKTVRLLWNNEEITAMKRSLQRYGQQNGAKHIFEELNLSNDAETPSALRKGEAPSTIGVNYA